MTESWKVITNKTCSMHAVQLGRLLIRKKQKKREHTEGGMLGWKDGLKAYIVNDDMRVR